MKKRIALLCTAALVFSLSACGQTEQTQNESEAEVQTESQNESQTDTPSEAPADAANGELAMSDMVIRITSQEYTATFQMYDTAAAEELYEQLPLELELSNFADAQWMFYPPEELNVTDEEIYRDGKKGELSYYEPWGDVFMLYEDFQSGDNMHRLGVCLSGIDEIEHMSGNVSIEKEEETEPAENTSEGIQQEDCTNWEKLFPGQSIFLSCPDRFRLNNLKNNRNKSCSARLAVLYDFTVNLQKFYGKRIEAPPDRK